MPDAVAGVGPTQTGAAGTTPDTAVSAFGELDEDAFLSLLVAQLRYQNPAEPADPEQMMTQVAQLTQVQTLNQLRGLLTSSLGHQQTATATTMLGKQVTAADPDDLAADSSGQPSAAVTGTVETVSFSDGGPQLSVRTAAGDLQVVRMEDVLTVDGADRSAAAEPG